MKKTLFFGLLLMVSVAFGSNAPEVIQKEFDQRFPGATDVSWERESPKGWIAEFIWNDRNVAVNYAFSGQWIETKIQIQESELPAAVKETIGSFYPDWKIVAATKIENTKMETLFKAAIQKESKLQEIVLKEEGTLLVVGLE